MLRPVLQTGSAWAVTLSILVHAAAILAVSFIVVSAGRYDSTPSESITVTTEWNDWPSDSVVPEASVDSSDPLREYIKNCNFAGDENSRSALNGFQDLDDGGSEYSPVEPRSGGGGGDDRDQGDLGHVQPTFNEWNRTALKRVRSEGAGQGLGDGASEGARGSSGNGTGFGAGSNGAGFGNGKGQAAKIGLTRPALLINLEDEHHRIPSTRVNVEVTVTLSIEVLVDGQVGAVKIKKPSGNEKFDKTAAKAAQNWRFKPALSQGDPVASWITIKQTKY